VRCRDVHRVWAQLRCPYRVAHFRQDSVHGEPRHKSADVLRSYIRDSDGIASCATRDCHILGMTTGTDISTKTNETESDTTRNAAAVALAFNDRLAR
jgi:hypothetical protein